MVTRVSTKRSPRAAFNSSQWVGGVVVGLAVAVTASLLFARKPQPVVPEKEIVAEYNLVQIPVPRDPVPAGTDVSRIATEMVSYPEHQLPPDVVRNLDEYQGTIVRAPLPAGLPIISRNLGLKGVGSNQVIEKIPPGMRAMAVKVDATSAVEGWATSGSVVDVLLIEKNGTSVVAEKVKILSAERSTTPDDGLGSATVPSTVTLLVTQEQCLAIITAQGQGRIALALRGNADDSDWEATTYSTERLNKNTQGTGKNPISGSLTVKQDGKDEHYVIIDGKLVKTDLDPKEIPAQSNSAGK